MELQDYKVEEGIEKRLKMSVLNKKNAIVRSKDKTGRLRLTVVNDKLAVTE